MSWEAASELLHAMPVDSPCSSRNVRPFGAGQPFQLTFVEMVKVVKCPWLCPPRQQSWSLPGGHCWLLASRGTCTRLVVTGCYGQVGWHGLGSCPCCVEWVTTAKYHLVVGTWFWFQEVKGFPWQSSLIINVYKTSMSRSICYFILWNSWALGELCSPFLVENHVLTWAARGRGLGLFQL